MNKCIHELVHAKIVLASQGLGGDDVGHHLVVKRIDDGPVQALGDGHAMVMKVWFINLRASRP